MPYYEIIYESGENSIANYADDEEAKRAIDEHVRRAKAGEPATPASADRSDLETPPVGVSSWPAQRIVKVLVYEKHPNDYGDMASAVSAEVAKKTISECIEKVKDSSGVVSIPELTAAILETTNPRVDSAPHETNFKMEHVRELKA